MLVTVIPPWRLPGVVAEGVPGMLRPGVLDGVVATDREKDLDGVWGSCREFNGCVMVPFAKALVPMVELMRLRMTPGSRMLSSWKCTRAAISRREKSFVV